MSNRRDFLKKSVLAATAISIAPLHRCSTKPKNTMPKISLAQWSLNRAFFAKTLDPIDFAHIAKEYDISAIEYVNQFYTDNAANESFWKEMATRADDAGVQSLIMMVDEEEKLGDLRDAQRLKAVEDHYKWVNAAKILGCHSIRVNAFGEGTKEELKTSLTDGLGRLTEYTAKEKIHVIIENHGLHTSDARYIVDLIKSVDNPFLGTLPDFGNWCTTAEWGGTKTSQQCEESYDPAEGIAEFLPFAKGVSAKSYEFDAEGYDTVIDYPKLLQLVKESDFDGHIGIEFEGEANSEPEGIRMTKELIEKVWADLK